MKPEIDQVLRTAAGQLMLEIAPRIGEEHTRTTAALLAAMLGTAAEEYDRAAEVRHLENQDFRTLFRTAAPRVSDAGLATRLERAANAPEPSLRVSELNRANDELRRLLIELHVHVEESEGPDARRLEDEIWQALRRSAERRMHPFVGG